MSTTTEIVVPIVTTLAGAATTSGVVTAWFSRKSKKDRKQDQDKKEVEIDQLKLDVTNDVVVLLRDELKRKAEQAIKDDEVIQRLDRENGFLRRRIFRLEEWAEKALSQNPNLPPLPHTERFGDENG